MRLQDGNKIYGVDVGLVLDPLGVGERSSGALVGELIEPFLHGGIGPQTEESARDFRIQAATHRLEEPGEGDQVMLGNVLHRFNIAQEALLDEARLLDEYAGDRRPRR